MIITAVGGNSVPPGQNKTFEELRRATLENFKKASTIIAGYSDADMENLKVAFHGKKLPFWNMINGPDVGVEIYLYKKRFVHAKTIVADGQLAIVGSANMDHRSFELNFEVNSVIYDHEIAQQLRIAFFEHLKEADKIDPGIWAKRSRFSQLPEKLARLLSPLL
jgi:hypothetical protein